MKYALDTDHNLVPGDDLTFKYMGSGVATFVDKDDTGFRIPIGTRNLDWISADGTVQLEDEGEAEKQGGYEDLFTNKQLRALCTEREIPVKGQLSKPNLAALLVEWDQTHPVQVEDAD